jgi:hypothetical protein
MVHNPPGEAMRVAINRWIRTGGGFDRWFDFDKAVRSVSNPDDWQMRMILRTIRICWTPDTRRWRTASI